MTNVRLGIAGQLTKAFITSPLTPLFLFAALVVGLVALVTLPREEEPQISVPMVDIHVRADGLKAEDAVKLVTEPLETIVKSIDGVEHVYSQTRDDGAMVTARFLVGTSSDAAILRVHEKIRANMDRIPVGMPEPLIVGRGIDDVAIVVLTLSPKPEAAAHWTANGLSRVARELQVELAKLDDIGLTYIVGAQGEEIRIEPDPEKLSLYGITLQQLAGKLGGANRSFQAGQIRDDDKQVSLMAGQTLQTPAEIGNILLTARDGRPVYVRDVANVLLSSGNAEHRVSNVLHTPDGMLAVPAVSLAIAKRPGTNAVVISEHIVERLEQLKGQIIPEDVTVDITRNYGETANEKANELLFHLALATISIVILVALSIGWREAIVVAIVIPTTILLTLFAARLMGYTLNRVSLFALIFSIGILVDDAIVVIENIARHWAMKDGRSRVTAAIDAVAEVGNPTIVATLTVVAALLPMLFVSGLMGPYMSPIPANASAAMIFSFFVAVMVTPWLMMKLAPANAGDHGHGDAQGGRFGRSYLVVARPILKSKLRGLDLPSRRRHRDAGVAGAVLHQGRDGQAAALRQQVGAAGRRRSARRFLGGGDRQGAARSRGDRVGLARCARPSDLCRHRRALQLQRPRAPLLPAQPARAGRSADQRSSRGRSANGPATTSRSNCARSSRASSCRKEPPSRWWSRRRVRRCWRRCWPRSTDPMPRPAAQTAAKVREAFEKVPFIVDVDDSYGVQTPRVRVSIDQDNLEYHKVQESDVYDTLQALYAQSTVGYSHRGEGRQPIPINLGLPKGERVISEKALSTPVAGQCHSRRARRGGAGRCRAGRHRTVFVSDLPPQRPPGRDGDGGTGGRFRGAGLRHDRGEPRAGQHRLDRPRAARDRAARPAARRVEARPAVGRRMGGDLGDLPRHGRGLPRGAARHLHAGGGAVPVLQAAAGDPDARAADLHRHHARPLALRCAFTATSMIGFIALAGIIVRNSILLVDFIRHSWTPDRNLHDVLLEAGAIRFKPILLTAIAAMIGAAVILTDPIFQGLAISLLFGLASSTLLTVLVIPAIYLVLRGGSLRREPVTG